MTASLAPQPSTVRPSLLILALWCGLVTGFGEVVLLGIQKLILGRFVFLSGDVVWMAPAMNVVYCLLVGGVFALVRLKWPTLAIWPKALAIYLFLGFSAWLLMYQPLHKGAALVLALGLSIQGSRLAARRPVSVARLTGRTAPLLGIGVVALALGAWGREAWHERQAVAALPAAQAGLPNVLVIILDTVRALDLSVYGFPKPTTPNLEKLAAGGARFDRAVATSPWTLPSHASVFTGRLPHELGVDWLVPLDDRYPTLAEVLAAQGYMTAGFAANTTYCSEESGLARGFAHYEAYPRSLEMAVKNTSLGRVIAGHPRLRRALQRYQPLARVKAPSINRSFLDWLDASGDRPFFVFLNYYDAHAPYLPPPPFDSGFGPIDERPTIPVRAGISYEAQEVAAQRAAYDGAIAYVDHHVGELLAALESRGFLEQTLVVVTSDHGEEFNEHGLMDHGYSLYFPSVHVPLILSYPGHLPEGSQVTSPVSIRDIPATVMSLVGLGAASPFPGRSLTSLLDQAQGTDRDLPPVFASVTYAPGLPPAFPVSKGPMESILWNGYRYIQNGDGTDELYRMGVDTLEQHDLSNQPDHAQAKTELRAILDSELRETGSK